MSWFAERADRIILLFDAHKLDISDEFKQAIQAIRKQEDKIRIVLNKVDSRHDIMIMMMMSDVTTGRHDDTPAADEGVRGADVESGQDPPEPRGDISNNIVAYLAFNNKWLCPGLQNIRGELLEPTPAIHRQQVQNASKSSLTLTFKF